MQISIKEIFYCLHCFSGYYFISLFHNYYWKQCFPVEEGALNREKLMLQLESYQVWGILLKVYVCVCVCVCV